MNSVKAYNSVFLKSTLEDQIENKQVDRSLLSILALYLKRQHEFYVNYMQGFKELATFLELSSPESFTDLPYFPEVGAPNICSRCLRLYGITASGKIQDGCFQCFNEVCEVPALEKGLSYTIGAMADDVLIGVSAKQIEVHLCWALYLSKAEKEKIKENVGPKQPARQSTNTLSTSEQRQDVIERRHDDRRVRRFNFRKP